MALVGLLDCNNFFVSCERLFRPDLWDKPVAVLSSNDGCIVARSQEVKDLGIPMGAPYFQVQDICKREHVTLFSGNLTFYRDISARVMQTLADEVGACEIYSVDEAFFSVPDVFTEHDAQGVRDALLQKVGIPVSVGVARTKTLAKVASEIGKKGDGAFLLTQALWRERSLATSTGSIWGLGRAMTAKLGEMGVKSAAEFMALTRSSLRCEFGIGTERIYDELHGKQVFSVGENSEALRQSIASTRSFTSETRELEDLETAVAGHVVHVAEKLRNRGLCTSRVYVQLLTNRHRDFFMQGGSGEIVLSVPVAETKVLLKAALAEVRKLYKKGVPYKKTGVTVSGLLPESYTTQNLFDETSEVTDTKLDEAIDTLNNRFGRGTIQPGVLLRGGAKTSATLRSPNYTTLWKDIPRIETR